MLTHDRYREILEILRIKGTATVAELAQTLNISESTVRRDLTNLDRENRLKKVHGGAVSIEKNFSANMEDVRKKALLNVPEKVRIAKYAAGLINDDDFVFIDAGTTTAHMPEYIKQGSKATFVTNGIFHAKKLIQKGFTTYITGGQLKLATEAIVGAVAIESVKQYNFTKAFMGANGVSIESGYTTPDAQEALLKSEICKRAQVTYVLADSSKIGRVSAITFAELKSAIIITDALENKNYTKYTTVKVAED